MLFLFYPLAALWAVGCLSIVGWGIYRTAKDRKYGQAFAVVALLLPVAAFMAYAPWGVWAEVNSPVLATLYENEWQCARGHREHETQHAARTTRTTTRFVCDVYERKKR